MKKVEGTRADSNRKVVDERVEIDILVLGQSDRKTNDEYEEEYDGKDNVEKASSPNPTISAPIPARHHLLSRRQLCGRLRQSAFLVEILCAHGRALGSNKRRFSRDGSHRSHKKGLLGSKELARSRPEGITCLGIRRRRFPFWEFVLVVVRHEMMSVIGTRVRFSL